MTLLYTVNLTFNVDMSLIIIYKGAFQYHVCMLVWGGELGLGEGLNLNAYNTFVFNGDGGS